MSLIENIPGTKKYVGCGIYNGEKYDLFSTYNEIDAIEYCLKYKCNIISVVNNFNNKRYYVKDSKHFSDFNGKFVVKKKPITYEEVKKKLDSKKGLNKYPKVTTYLLNFDK